LREFKETVESLWSVTRKWMDANREWVVPQDRPDNLMEFITDDGGKTYNLCHFWSNFEVWKEKCRVHVI
jgi:alpha 1,2-mannosyltransferase